MNRLDCIVGIVLLALMLILSGCSQPQEQQTWGKGDPPDEWQSYFGNGNNARLDYMQQRAIAEIAKELQGFVKLNSDQHKKLAQNDIDQHRRIKELERAMPYSPIQIKDSNSR